MNLQLNLRQFQFFEKEKNEERKKKSFLNNKKTAKAKQLVF